MISTIRYPSFKHIDMRSRKSYVSFYLLALMVALIYLYSQVVLLVLAAVYATSGFLMKIYQMAKHKNEAILPADQLFPSSDDTK
jgi:phosphatidylserine synthase